MGNNVNILVICILFTCFLLHCLISAGKLGAFLCDDLVPIMLVVCVTTLYRLEYLCHQQDPVDKIIAGLKDQGEPNPGAQIYNMLLES